MASQENNQSDAPKEQSDAPKEQSDAPKEQQFGDSLEHHEVKCPTVGTFHVYVQGTRSNHEVVILTVHDLGCNHMMYLDFVGHPKMQGIRDRTVWVHVDVPGQQPDAPDLPTGESFPTMQKIGEELIEVLNQLKVKEVVCFGEGAGANILARFAMAHNERVLGVCLLHCTGTTAGFLESLKDKIINYKLDHVGMNPTAESYLVLHRYGSTAASAEANTASPKKTPTLQTQGRRLSFYERTIEKIIRPKMEGESPKEEDEDKHQELASTVGDSETMLKTAIENYQSNLRTKTNPKNLKKFVEAFLKRTTIADGIKKIKCPALFVTGAKSVFNNTTRALHQKATQGAADKGVVEFMEVQGVANILEEKPEKMVESFQYFMQGLGLVSSVRMQRLAQKPLLRSMSMEDYDQPLLKKIQGEIDAKEAAKAAAEAGSVAESST